MTKLSRRDFLKGAAAGAASVVAMGIVGCAAPNGETDTAASEVQTTAAETKAAETAEETKAFVEAGAGAEKGTAGGTKSPGNVQAFLSENLNPQASDDGFYSNTINDFSAAAMFSPWKFGALTVAHRIVKSAAGSAYLPTALKEEVIAEYTNWAKGGVSLIWVEDFANLYANYPAHYKTYTREDAYMRELTDAIHAQGSVCGYQLSLMGASFSGFDASAAAEYESARADQMTKEELKKLQEDFIDAAKYLKEQGFDAVEINAAGNNIGQAFLSRNRNAREDEYGPQSFENRTRFLAEIIQGIKGVNGQDFPVQILINGIEENDKDLGKNTLFTTVEENKEIARMLEAAGADALHVRIGPYAMHVAEFAGDLYFTGYGINGTTAFGTQFDFSRHFQGKLDASHSGCGILLNVAAEIKSAVSIPVGTVTYMDPAIAPDYFEKALADGKIDFMLMTRPLIADPEYVNKLREGRLDEIRVCNRCLSCHFDTDENGGFYEHCRVNACHMRAYHEDMPEGYEEVPAAAVKNVMVIGGGPAGMEAARVAAKRGHKVTLYEKNGLLGGMLPFASAVKGPHENLGRYKDYLVRQLELQNVEVVLNQEVTSELIAEKGPDAVILAAGGLRDSLGLKGTAGTKVISIDDFAGADLGENVTVVGSGAQAIDVTLYLQAQGRHVTIVTPDPLEKMDKEQTSWVRTFVNPMILARGTRVWPNASIVSVGDGEITVSGETGVDMVIKCDTVIEAMDMLPNKGLLDGLSGVEAYAVGDCEKPWNIAEAVAGANLAARRI